MGGDVREPVYMGVGHWASQEELQGNSSTIRHQSTEPEMNHSLLLFFFDLYNSSSSEFPSCISTSPVLSPCSLLRLARYYI